MTSDLPRRWLKTVRATEGKVQERLAACVRRAVAFLNPLQNGHDLDRYDASANAANNVGSLIPLSS